VLELFDRQSELLLAPHGGGGAGLRSRASPYFGRIGPAWIGARRVAAAAEDLERAVAQTGDLASALQRLPTGAVNEARLAIGKMLRQTGNGLSQPGFDSGTRVLWRAAFRCGYRNAPDRSGCGISEGSGPASGCRVRMVKITFIDSSGKSSHRRSGSRVRPSWRRRSSTASRASRPNAAAPARARPVTSMLTRPGARKLVRLPRWKRTCSIRLRTCGANSRLSCQIKVTEALERAGGLDARAAGLNGGPELGAALVGVHGFHRDVLDTASIMEQH